MELRPAAFSPCVQMRVAGQLEPIRKKSERSQTLVSFWPALLFRGADMRALRFRSNRHGLGQDPVDRKCLLSHTIMPDGLLATVAQSCRDPVDGQMNALHDALVRIPGPVPLQELDLQMVQGVEIGKPVAD